MHNMEILLDNKHKNVVKKVKKAVNTRWLSLHAFVDGVYKEYENHEKVQSLLECCIH